MLSLVFGGKVAAGSAQPAQALVLALPLLLSFFLACVGSGTLVARFGGAAGRREAIGGNLLGSAVVLVLATLGAPLSIGVILGAAGSLAVCSLLGGLLGAVLGKKLRP